MEVLFLYLFLKKGGDANGYQRKKTKADRHEGTGRQGLKRASVYAYLPYSKGSYNLSELTLYAEHGKAYRKRKNVVKGFVGN